MMIVIVEDNLKHQQEAKELVKKAGCEVPSRSFLPSNLKSFMFIYNLFEKWKDEGKEVGVLTDMYFPAEPNHIERMELAPLGMVVMALCRERGIPCVIVTAGYHHGIKYHELCCAGRQLGWPEMVDSTLEEVGEASRKNWEQGLKRLLAIAAEARPQA